jgi:uncharacterized membrane protein
MTPIHYIHLLVAFVFLALALVLYFFPARKINLIYGYRTARSMKNEETWKEGNQYSNRLFFKITAVTLITQLVTFIVLDGVTSLFISMGVYLAGIVLSLILTEKHLKGKFG